MYVQEILLSVKFSAINNVQIQRLALICTVVILR